MPEHESETGQEQLKWRVVYEAPHQCHYFNCPFQLGYDSGDMVRSCSVGRDSLVVETQ